MIALSTSWISAKAENGTGVISQILDIGFRAVELDYRLTSAKLNEMKPMLGRDIQVVSVHNFCPVPDILPREMGGSDAFLLSSSNREERERAVEYTIRTIELADSVGARIVVCHLGHVEMDDPTEKLLELYVRGEKESSDFESLFHKARDRRDAERQRNLDSVLFSLDKLNRRAEKLDVFLGIENRRDLRQIPGLDEIDIILGEFDGANLTYWHNTGHAQIQDYLGIASHEDFLKQYSDRMIGIHLQDIKSIREHMVPGAGDLDFKMVSEYLSPDVVRVMQLAPDTTREEIEEGLSYLEELGI